MESRHRRIELAIDSWRMVRSKIAVALGMQARLLIFARHGHYELCLNSELEKFALFHLGVSELSEMLIVSSAL